MNEAVANNYQYVLSIKNTLYKSAKLRFKLQKVLFYPKKHLTLHPLPVIVAGWAVFLLFVYRFYSLFSIWGLYPNRSLR